MTPTQRSHPRRPSQPHLGPVWVLTLSLAWLAAIGAPAVAQTPTPSASVTPTASVALSLALRIGGGEDDYAYSVAASPGGDITVAGTFRGTVDVDPSVGVAAVSSVGGTDVFVARFSAGGTLLWATSFGSVDDDTVTAVAAGPSGEAFVGGWFRGTIDLDSGAGAFEVTSAGDDDIYLVKLNNAGQFEWGHRIGAAGSDRLTALAAGPQGGVHATGRFESTVDFNAGNGQFFLSAGRSSFAMRYESDGRFSWAAPIGDTSGFNSGFGIAVDALGRTIVVGQHVNAEAFIASLDVGGRLRWWRVIGGNAQAFVVAYAVAVDSTGQIYLTGRFNQTIDFDPGAGISPLIGQEGDLTADVFLARFDPDSRFVWALAIGGNGADIGTGVAVDAAGRVVVTGTFEQVVNVDPRGVFELLSSGLEDGFVARFDSDANLHWAAALQGPNNDRPAAVAVDALGGVVVVGRFQTTTDFDPGPGQALLSVLGLPFFDDAFVWRLQSDAPIAPTPAPTATPRVFPTFPPLPTRNPGPTLAATVSPDGSSGNGGSVSGIGCGGGEMLGVGIAGICLMLLSSTGDKRGRSPEGTRAGPQQATGGAHDL